MEKLKILAIEDDPLCAELFKKKLADDFYLEFAHSLKDGLRKLDETRWSVIFLDLGMHDAKRETIVNEVKPKSGGAALIILTGHKDPRLRDLLMIQQVDGFMVKGIEDSKQDIHWIIQQALEFRKTHS